MSQPEPFFNYVRCPDCGGNLSDTGHPCDDEARQRRVNEEFARFTEAVRVDPTDATADQLRSKLVECEEALRTTEAVVQQQDSTIERLEAQQAAALALHPVRESVHHSGFHVCGYCVVAAPCPTRRALTEDTP